MKSTFGGTNIDNGELSGILNTKDINNPSIAGYDPPDFNKNDLEKKINELESNIISGDQTSAIYFASKIPFKINQVLSKILFLDATFCKVANSQSGRKKADGSRYTNGSEKFRTLLVLAGGDSRQSGIPLCYMLCKSESYENYMSLISTFFKMNNLNFTDFTFLGDNHISIRSAVYTLTKQEPRSCYIHLLRNLYKLSSNKILVKLNFHKMVQTIDQKYFEELQKLLLQNIKNSNSLTYKYLENKTNLFTRLNSDILLEIFTSNLIEQINHHIKPLRSVNIVSMIPSLLLVQKEKINKMIMERINAGVSKQLNDVALEQLNKNIQAARMFKVEKVEDGSFRIRFKNELDVNLLVKHFDKSKNVNNVFRGQHYLELSKVSAKVTYDTAFDAEKPLFNLKCSICSKSKNYFCCLHIVSVILHLSNSILDLQKLDVVEQFLNHFTIEQFQQIFQIEQCCFFDKQDLFETASDYLNTPFMKIEDFIKFANLLEKMMSKNWNLDIANYENDGVARAKDPLEIRKGSNSRK